MSRKPSSILLLITLVLSAYLLVFIWDKAEIIEPKPPPAHNESANVSTQGLNDSSLTNKQISPLNLSLPEEKGLNANSFITSPLHSSYSEWESAFNKHSDNEHILKINNMPDLFSQKIEPKGLFGSPLGGRLLLDEDNEITGLEINIVVKK